MRLFELDDYSEVKINKPWIVMIPEFKVLWDRDKASKSKVTDGHGVRIKAKAMKEFTFIYFFVDFSSPIRDWEEGERRREALYYAKLEDKDVDDKLMIAVEKYRQLMLEGARSLRTYRALLKTQDSFDAYFENLDLTETSKRTGELLNTPDKVAATVARMAEMHKTIKNFAVLVEEELTQAQSTIRGVAEMGDQEGKGKKIWDEQEIAEGSSRENKGEVKSGGTFTDLLHVTQGISKTD